MRAAIAAAIACAVLAGGCRQFGPRATRVTARVTAPTRTIDPGEQQLGLGTAWYRGLRRDGILYIPTAAATGRPVPLLVLLHAGGDQAEDFRFALPIGEEFGVALLLLDARHNTWDGVDSPFGVDVLFIDQALRHTFDRVAIDPRKVGLGGLSDGGMYALSVGTVNGDLFTHLFAVAPGYMDPPGPLVGKPRILLAHGTRDAVYSVAGSRNRIRPALQEGGYDVTYLEFDGVHQIPPDVLRQALSWLLG